MTADRRLAAAGFGLVLAIAGCGPTLPAADLIFLDAQVVTMDPALPLAEAVAIREGRILLVGSNSEVGGRRGPSTRVVSLGGRTLLPGFVDAHLHPVTGGMRLAACDLSAETTPEGILQHIAGCVAATDSGWVLGSGWDLPIFPDGNPRKEWLDSLTGDRPAMFRAADGHSAWVNSAALRLAGIDRDTQDPPPDGRIERDRRGGATGTLREQAMQLIEALVPAPSLDERRAGLVRTLALLNQAGVTAFQEASGTRSLLEAYQALDRAGELTARVQVAMLATPESDPATQVDTLAARRAEFTSGRVRAEAVKLFLDGVIEARTAAMLAPYSDRPRDAGTPSWHPGQLDSMVMRLVDSGFTVHMHAIGDRAVRMGLDAVERAETGRSRGSRRHQIAHLEVIDPADVPRFRALDVIANFQPLWAFPDRYIVELTWPGLGADRSRWIYPIGAVERAGGPLALGSDWSVSSLVPLEGIEVAVTRKNFRDGDDQALLPEQAVSLEAALRAYTLGSARALGIDGLIGSVVVGKAADLVVLDQAILSVAPDRIGEIGVLLTLLDGVPVAGSLDSLAARVR